MIHRELGRTKRQVSAIAFGTVALGTPYGFGDGESRQPPAGEAIALLRYAASSGVTLFDTAPAYGSAEELVGSALGDDDRCVIATKVTVPHGMPASDLRRTLTASLEESRRKLRRDVLDIVQIHNATPATLAMREVIDTLVDARSRGRVRFLGASVYTADESLAAVDSGWVDVLQVPFNVLDQRIVGPVLDQAVRCGVGVMTRSALLRGALTERATRMSPELDRLRQSVDRARLTLGSNWSDLPEIALRFCFSQPGVASVLVGASSRGELDQALVAVEAGPLPPALMKTAATLGMAEERLIDPRQWPPA